MPIPQMNPGACLTVDKFMETVDKIFSHADGQAVFAVFASDKFTRNYVKKAFFATME
jgi:hypothetical protein